MQMSGYDPGILKTLTIKAASDYAANSAVDGLYGSGSDRDHHTQSSVFDRVNHEPPSINNFRNFISNANEFNSFMDFIYKQPINRKSASDPFIHEKIGESWNNIPESAKNWRPNNWLGRIVVNRGSHKKNKRLPGGNHLTVDLGEDIVRVHRDYFDSLKGIRQAYNHYLFEYVSVDKDTYKFQDDASDWDR